MTKTISSQLQTKLSEDVIALATAIEIIRTDGRIFRVTSHDADLTIDGEAYSHEHPFTLSALSSGSGFSVDDAEVTLSFDSTLFIRSDFEAGLFKHAAIKIMDVDFEDLSAGPVVLREGWIGEVTINRHDVCKLVVEGLLKIFDLSIGRIYQPSCDADLGDSRCKLAIDLSQQRDSTREYHVGQWAYVFDENLLTSITINNPGFEDNAGTVASNQPISGWTRAAGGEFSVTDSGFPPTPIEGTYKLQGLAHSGPNKFEDRVYQDVATVTTTMADADIDDGKLFVRLKAAVSNTSTLIDPFNLSIEFFDVNGNQIFKKETGFKLAEKIATWQYENITSNVPPGTRFMRISLWGKKESSSLIDVAFDDVRFDYWDHTQTSPHGDRTYKVVKVSRFNDTSSYKVPNYNFEDNSLVANTNVSGNIDGWTFSSSDYWQVVASTSNLAVQSFSFFLLGGDDGSNVQKTYSMNQELDLSTIPYAKDTAKVDLSQIAMVTRLLVGFDNLLVSAGITLEFLDSADAVISSSVQSPLIPTVVGWITVNFYGTLPPSTRKVRIKLEATSPVADSNAAVGFDNVRFWFFPSDVVLNTDQVFGFGRDDTTFSTTIGNSTIDNELSWKTQPSQVYLDTVAAVTDRKTFSGTLIAGIDGTYEAGEILWLSGNNANQKNIIRNWESATQTVKMYFPSPLDISIGDRFMYTKPCHKRFDEDCKVTFDNVVNFRGYPVLPGRIDG